MHCVDVNVLVQACVEASPRHQQARSWLLSHRTIPTGLGLFSVVVSGFLRVVTDRRVFTEPMDPGDAIAFVDSLTASPTVSLLEPGPRHWQLFRAMVLEHRPSAVDMTDVYLAAAAIEARGTWVSFDRGFGRFRQLRWISPADGAP
ncbi:MAG: TA system VapC family ribonuclease toxin [Cyanobium sp.]